jgi:hypothetical protein
MPKAVSTMDVLALSFEDRLAAIQSGPKKLGVHIVACKKAQLLLNFPCICLAVKEGKIVLGQKKEVVKKTEPSPEERERKDFLKTLLHGNEEQKRELAQKVINSLEDKGLNEELVGRLEKLLSGLGKKYLIPNNPKPTTIINITKVVLDVGGYRGEKKEEIKDDEIPAGTVDDKLADVQVGYLGVPHSAFNEARSYLAGRNVIVRFINFYDRNFLGGRFDVLVVNKYGLGDENFKGWEVKISGKKEIILSTTSVGQIVKPILACARRAAKRKVK